MQNVFLDRKEHTFIYMKSKLILYSEAKLINKYVTLMNGMESVL